MTNTYLAAARDLVIKGMCESQVALSVELEFYLASTLAHYIDHPIMPDRLTLRLMDMVQRRARRVEPRELGDECLISCAFFAARLTRHGGTIVHYAGLGQNAYEIAGMPDVAHGFPDMLDVLQASKPISREHPPRSDDKAQEEHTVLFLGQRHRY
jgi:hypothetical protein